MTPLRKLTFLILTILLIVIITVAMGRFVYAILLLPLITYLSYKWYFLLNEELIIYHLMRNSNRMEFKRLVEFFGKKANKIVRKLINKNILEMDDSYIILKINDYKFSMTKWRPGN